MFSCCICDCRIPKRTQYGSEKKKEEEEESGDESAVSMSTRSFPSTLPRRQNSGSSSQASQYEADLDRKTKHWQNLKNILEVNNALRHAGNPPTRRGTALQSELVVKKTVTATSTLENSLGFPGSQNAHTTRALDVSLDVRASNGRLPNERDKNWMSVKKMDGSSNTCSPNRSRDLETVGSDNLGFAN